MKKYIRWLVPLLLLGAGVVLTLLATRHSIAIVIDGKSRRTTSNAIWVGQVLRQSGIEIAALDQIAPAPSTPAAFVTLITIRRARPVTILGPDNTVIGQITSAERIPANLLFAAAKKRLFPGDSLSWNGEILDPAAPLPLAASYLIKYTPGIKINLVENNLQHIFYSSRPTLGQALWDQGFTLTSDDTLSRPFSTPLTQALVVYLRRAAPLTIQVGDKNYSLKTAAQTVGQALLEAGMSLQTNDTVQPGEDQPLPADGIIHLTRVNEQIQIEQTVIPFESEYVSSDQVDLDQRQVIQAGQYGLKVSRIRIIYQNGVESGRKTESDWTASQPVKQKVGYGTRVKIQTIATSSGTLEYYRAVNVYATSYSPCRSGASRCYNSTTSGMAVQKGVIGVTRTWYNLLVGQRVYIPGYGIAVIADVGGGISGKKWIDLGFSDSDYEGWGRNVTMYFLTPVPSNVPWTLP